MSINPIQNTNVTPTPPPKRLPPPLPPHAKNKELVTLIQDIMKGYQALIPTDKQTKIVEKILKYNTRLSLLLTKSGTKEFGTADLKKVAVLANKVLLLGDKYTFFKTRSPQLAEIETKTQQVLSNISSKMKMDKYLDKKFKPLLENLEAQKINKIYEDHF